MTDKLKIGIAGLGTVGQAVAKQLLSGEVDARLQLVCVTAKQRARQRALDLSSVTWLDDPLAMAQADIDVVLELIGGADGIALALTQAALKAGKHVITANKAMLATHGTQLASLAEKQKLNLAYEAAVAGGIPVIKTVREGLAGNKIQRICGILNGTCNFILSEMQASAMHAKRVSFDETLAKAQTLGYAESDPTFDISGVDAAQKLAILSSLAFGTKRLAMLSRTRHLILAVSMRRKN
ncbi:MAG: homoserine dehydrogenase [Alphaproteobacteria bacterium]|nr:homoserine dehydrogenase [Alphaproteobacteria bacterium]